MDWNTKAIFYMGLERFDRTDLYRLPLGEIEAELVVRDCYNYVFRGGCFYYFQDETDDPETTIANFYQLNMTTGNIQEIPDIKTEGYTQRILYNFINEYLLVYFYDSVGPYGMDTGIEKIYRVDPDLTTKTEISSELSMPCLATIENKIFIKGSANGIGHGVWEIDSDGNILQFFDK